MNLNAIKNIRLMSITVASFHFNPGIISSLVTAVLLYTMLSLGNWQLGRADYKDTLQQKIAERKNLMPSGINDLPETLDDRRYLPLKFIAEYDLEHSFLLDNITFNGKVGYHVYTAVKLAAGKAILVNRGFIAQGASRQQLPELITPGGKIEINGLLDLPPSRALVLAENFHDSSQWPMVLQYIDLNELNEITEYELYDMVLWLDKEEPGIFDYDLPVLNLNSAKNNGYAFQWFAMSLALVLIYIFVNTRRKQ